MCREEGRKLNQSTNQQNCKFQLFWICKTQRTQNLKWSIKLYKQLQNNHNTTRYKNLHMLSLTSIHFNKKITVPLVFNWPSSWRHYVCFFQNIAFQDQYLFIHWQSTVKDHDLEKVKHTWATLDFFLNFINYLKDKSRAFDEQNSHQNINKTEGMSHIAIKTRQFLRASVY